MESGGTSLAILERYSQNTNKWETIQVIDRLYDSNDDRMKIPLSNKGSLWIFPNMIREPVANKITKDLEFHSKYLFRNYRIQGIEYEPRLQAHFHDGATEHFSDKQPGYRYGATTMKARPLSIIGSLKALSKHVCECCGHTGQWKIGVTAVIYRDTNDRIGQHSDDDQGASLIFCTVVNAPTTTSWVITIKEKGDKSIGKKRFDHQERIRLFLQKGDGYLMDGEMQKYYTHGVDPIAKEKPTSSQPSSSQCRINQRITVVFRDGHHKQYCKDTGKAIFNLNPRVLWNGPTFSRIHGLHEGKIYSREDLRQMKAHGLSQKGISSRRGQGCDAIIVSGKYQGIDEFVNLWYAAPYHCGGREFYVNQQKNLPIRLFRSTAYEHQYKAIVPTQHWSTKAANYYRYDGLYWIRAKQVKMLDGNEELFVYLVRIDGSKDMMNHPAYHNKIDNTNFMGYCINTKKTMQNPQT